MKKALITAAVASITAALALSGCGVSPENPSAPTTDTAVVGSPITVIGEVSQSTATAPEGLTPEQQANWDHMMTHCNKVWTDRWGTWQGCPPDPDSRRAPENGALGA